LYDTQKNVERWRENKAKWQRKCETNMTREQNIVDVEGIDRRYRTKKLYYANEA